MVASSGYSSDADNLVAADSNGARTDPFVRDMDTGKNMLADSKRSGASASRGGRFRRGPAGDLSGDGRYAVFTSNTPDLTGGVPAYTIFRRDLFSGQNQRACRAGDADAGNPVISADGQHVAFESRADTLAGRDRDLQPDVYWCDIPSGTLQRVSTPISDSVNTVGSSGQPSISADGRYVAFTSDAGGLVPGDGDRAGIYRKDMISGEIALVDVPAGATSSDGNGQNPKISADGRYVLFDSDATDLPGGSLNGRTIDVLPQGHGHRRGHARQPGQGRLGRERRLDRGLDLRRRLAGRVHVERLEPRAGRLERDGRRVRPHGRHRGDGHGLRPPRRHGPGRPEHPGGGERRRPLRGLLLARRERGRAARRRPPRAAIYRRDLATGALAEVSAGLDLPPSSLIGEPFGTNLRRKVHLVAGTSEDNGRVVQVRVAVSRSVGHGRCVWLTRGAHLVKKRCSQPQYLNARVTDGLRWTLRIPHLLPRGTYTVRSQAVDDTGLAEGFRNGRNVTSFSCGSGRSARALDESRWPFGNEGGPNRL